MNEREFEREIFISNLVDFIKEKFGKSFVEANYGLNLGWLIILPFMWNFTLRALVSPVIYVRYLTEAFSIIHELGHLLFFFTNDLLIIGLGGTFLQLLYPIVAIYAFAAKRKYFIRDALLVFLAINLMHVQWYMLDAIHPNPNATTFFNWGVDESQLIHDWEYIFGRLGVMGHVVFYANTVLLLAKASMLYGTLHATVMVIYGSYLQLTGKQKVRRLV